MATIVTLCVVCEMFVRVGSKCTVCGKPCTEPIALARKRNNAQQIAEFMSDHTMVVAAVDGRDAFVAKNKGYMINAMNTDPAIRQAKQAKLEEKLGLQVQEQDAYGSTVFVLPKPEEESK